MKLLNCIQFGASIALMLMLHLAVIHSDFSVAVKDLLFGGIDLLIIFGTVIASDFI